MPISGAKPTTPVQVVQSKPSGQPVAPVAMASTIHSTGALSGAHPKATGNSTTAKVQPGEQDSALVTAEQTDTVQTDHFYMGSIINEVCTNNRNYANKIFSNMQFNNQSIYPVICCANLYFSTTTIILEQV